MYCTIEEAWGNKINFRNNNHNHIQENYINNECLNFHNHINNCTKCKIELMKKMNISDILSLDDNTKETLLIFLIGLVVLIILNIFYK